MQTIGILGIKNSLTRCYVNTIDAFVKESLGDRAEADLIVCSGGAIAESSSNERPALLETRLTKLVSNKPDIVILADGGMHKTLDSVSGNIDFGESRVVHYVDETVKALRAGGCKNVLVLGAREGWDEDYHVPRLRRDFDLSVAYPPPERQIEISTVIAFLALSQNPGHVRQRMWAIMNGMREKYDAVILAHPSLSEVVDRTITYIPVIDPVKVHCRAAVDLAL